MDENHYPRGSLLSGFAGFVKTAQALRVICFLRHETKKRKETRRFPSPYYVLSFA